VRFLLLILLRLGFLCRVTGADSALGLDVTRLCEGDLGEEGADDLVNEDGEEGYALDDGALGAKLHCLRRHTKCDACLRKEGDAEILDDIVVTARHLRAYKCAEDLAQRAGGDIRDTDYYYTDAGEDGKVELCSAENEEEDEQGRRPAVYSVHKLLGEVAGVAEHRAEHHTNEKRGEADMYSECLDLKLEGRKRDGHHNEGNRDGKALRARMEESLDKGEDKSHNEAERKREDDLKDGLENDLKYIRAAVGKRLCDAEGYREEHESHRIIKRDDGKEDVCYGALCLILTDDHKRRCRSGGGGDRAKDDRGGKREQASEMQGD